MGKDLKGKEIGKGISQRKDGSYEGRFTNRAGKRVSIYNSKLSVVRTELEKAKYEDKMNLSIIEDGITLDDWYEKWITIYKFNIIADNTKRYYEQVYMKHISPALGKTKLNDIKQLKIKELLKSLALKGLGYSTQNKVRIILADMLSKALVDNYVNKNAAAGIKLIRDEKKDVRVLTIEEQREFFECSKGTFYDNLFTVAVTTGMRMGELCALTIDDLDFEKKEIRINKSLLYQKLDGDDKKTFHIGNTKTRSSIRTIPMNKLCEEALRKQIHQYRVVRMKEVKKIDEQFKSLLFTTKHGTPINAQTFCDAIGRIVDEINLSKDTSEEMEKFSSHCFRHTFASRCFEAGVQPKTVQHFLGHASLQMTMDLYTHVLEEQKQEEMSKVDDLFTATLAANDDAIGRFHLELASDDENDSNVIRFNKELA